MWPGRGRAKGEEPPRQEAPGQGTDFIPRVSGAKTPSVTQDRMCRDSYLFSEVCDGLLHFQNEVLEVICP